MIHYHLRYYSARELVLRQNIKAWRKQGFDLRQQIAPGRHLLHFVSDSGWEGIIDLEDWFSKKMPQSAELASASWSIDHLETLFVNSSRPIEGLPQELEYQHLESKGRVPPSFIEADQFACLTSQGRVWLHELPLHAPAQTDMSQYDVSHLPVRIQFQVGISKISIALLKQVQKGDVLLINLQHSIVVTEESMLGQFIRLEEGFMFDENQYVDMSDDETLQVLDSEPLPNALTALSSVKVKLGFVLQQTTISIAELEAFCSGKVLVCQPEVENNMLITANGVTIAKGELVRIEDRLGVEIKEMYQEVGNDSR
ncbi:FliM/FliN family flagellar motor switch protein [Yersinia kristensenii]|uniref:FliM/FliN family flagellar motor switch protein n=1 Tax=Yersinia kristensenii TaxID=28152 RepID=UPI0005E42EE8|nr:FliM/FliN family flagellar motor switch protein [Yersinia kristensenii]CNF34933.1 type III secretion apparatus protein [Yersinia kristensenii]